MLIDSPLTFGLTFGVDRRIPEADDARVLVPPVVNPIALMTQPHRVITTGETLSNGSGLNDFQSTVTNGGPTTTDCFTLPPGLYELEYSITAVFNFVGTVGTLNGVDVTLVYQGQSIQLVELAAQIGTQTYYGRVRLLLVQNAVLRLNLDANGVGQTTTSALMANAIRIL
jgi:hypothetical protein